MIALAKFRAGAVIVETAVAVAGRIPDQFQDY